MKILDRITELRTRVGTIQPLRMVPVDDKPAVTLPDGDVVLTGDPGVMMYLVALHNAWPKIEAALASAVVVHQDLVMTDYLPSERVEHQHWCPVCRSIADLEDG